MSQRINHAIELPENVTDILSQDFWMLENLSARVLLTAKGPIKFTSTVSIFVRKGEADVEVNLIRMKIKAPCVVNIKAGQILQVIDVAEDLDASFIVMSKRLIDNLFMAMNYSNMSFISHPVMMSVSPDKVEEYERFYSDCRKIRKEKGNPYIYQALLFTILAFFCKEGVYDWKASGHLSDAGTELQSRLCDRFLHLVQTQFREHRFLDFYATELGVSTKHLSRTVKKITGFTAVEWIERYVVLEAKVMLKWSNMTIQQIADDLNFPSQSFFGKYFKKSVGLSPKEFRNM